MNYYRKKLNVLAVLPVESKHTKKIGSLRNIYGI